LSGVVTALVIMTTAAVSIGIVAVAVRDVLLDDLRNYLRRKRTYPGLFPILHLDHIYYAGKVEIVHIELPRTRLSLVASDHLPLVADIRIG